jgi:hypothetical protein
MLSALKNHPFPVEAFFKQSLVLTFAAPKAELARLIPECLQLDTFKDQWAFIAVAMVRTSGLRPKGWPGVFGSDFFLIGYRVFVTYRTRAGKRLRGLYILKSETDKRRMQFFGNLFTHYHYSTTDIRQTGHSIRSVGSGLVVEISRDEREVLLPDGSPFADWKEARRYAGPLPFTFSYEKKSAGAAERGSGATERRAGTDPAGSGAGAGLVTIIEGVRENWEPRPVNVTEYRVAFIEHLQLSEVRLANAFVIENIPYYWKKGKTELWHH